MKKNVLFGIALVCSVFLSNEAMAQAAVSVDPATYDARGTISLQSKWLYSNKLNNYNAASDLLGAALTVRGMAAKAGKMYFCSRNAGNQILVVNGTTGARETPINLASNVFTYPGRNKANTADSTYLAALPCNDIQIDNAGNVLLGNLSTSNATRFQIWKVDVTTGAGTIVIDQANMATLFPLATTMRFDAFGVWGDVTKNAVILASNANALEVYKWTITAGVVSAPRLMLVDNTTIPITNPITATNPGTAPRVLPLDANYFYLDGNATFPVLLQDDPSSGYANTIDGFFNKLTALKDDVTIPGTTWTMNEGHNGVVEFQIGDSYFLLMAASNTAGVPASTFRLFKFADASKAFSGLTCLWTFPQAGMGGISNTYRTGMPAVEVTGNKANLYVYTGENGYGMYQVTVGSTAVKETQMSNVTVSFSGNQIRFSEEVATAEVYSVTGQKISTAKKVSTLTAPVSNGVYIVTLVDKSGSKKIQKIAIN